MKKKLVESFFKYRNKQKTFIKKIDKMYPNDEEIKKYLAKYDSNLDKDKEVKTYLVTILRRFGHLIRWFPFQRIRCFFYWIFRDKKPSEWLTEYDGKLVEILVFVDIIIGLLSIFCYRWLIGSVLILGLSIWAVIRISDIFVYQIYAIKVTGTSGLKSPSRMIALVLFNLFEIILWFAFFYMIFNDSFDYAKMTSSQNESI